MFVFVGSGFLVGEGIVVFAVFVASEFTHVDGDVVFFENLAAEYAFHYIFHGDHADEGTEFVDYC